MLKEELIKYLKSLPTNDRIKDVVSKLNKKEVAIPQNEKGKMEVYVFLAMLFGEIPRLMTKEQRKHLQDFFKKENIQISTTPTSDVRPKK